MRYHNVIHVDIYDKHVLNSKEFHVTTRLVKAARLRGVIQGIFVYV